MIKILRFSRFSKKIDTGKCFIHEFDELNNKFGPYENIKIDIDGNEKDLILGAEKTLESPNLKSILIELNEKDENFSSIVDHIKNKKFKLNEYLTNKSYISIKRSSKIYNLIFDKN